MNQPQETPTAYSVSIKDEDDQKTQIAVLAVVANVEAKIGKSTFSQIELAIQEAEKRYKENGQTVEIVLVQDTLIKKDPIEIHKDNNIRLDLDGKILTTASTDYVIKNYGQLEIVDYSDEKNGKIISTTGNVIYNGSEQEATEDSAEKEVIDLKDVKKYHDEDEYYFKYDTEDKKLKNTNNIINQDPNTNALGYIELDLSDKVGKYTLTVNAQIASSYGSIGYVSISNEPREETNIVMSTSYGNFINMSQNHSASDTKLDIVGGQKYYLNFLFRKSDRINVNNEFAINSITLTKKQEGTLKFESGTIEVDKVGNNSTRYSAITNAGIANIEGGKIESSQNYTSGITTMNGGTSNINGGDITLSGANTRAIWASQKGSLTQISAGTISANAGLITTEPTANAIVKGGTFSDSCQYQIRNSGACSRINVEKVTLTKNTSGYCLYSDNSYSDIIVNDCEISNSYTYAIYRESGNCTIEINESTISGKQAIYNRYGQGKISIKESEINTSSTAISISNSNSIIDVIDSNIEVETGQIISGNTSTNITIEDSILNDKDERNKNTAITLNSGNIDIKGDETVIKSVGRVIYSSNSSSNTEVNINIESGTLESTALGVIDGPNLSGSINLGKEDGYVNENYPILKSATSNWATYSNLMHLNIYDGKIIGEKEKIIGASIGKLEEGYELIAETESNEDGVEYQVVKLGTTTGVAELIPEGQSSGKTYNTIQEAVEACSTKNGENPSTIKLLKDVDLVRQIVIKPEQNIKLDLNNHKITVMTDDAIYNQGKLEIIDESTEEQSNEYNLIENAGTSIIRNAVVENEEETSVQGDLKISKGVRIYYTTSGTGNPYKKIINNEGKLTIDDGEESESNDKIKILGTGSYIYAIYNSGTMDVDGCTITIENINSTGIYNDSQNDSTIQDTNIKFTRDSGYGVYNNTTGKLCLNNGTKIETFAYSVYNKDQGTIVIDGADITCSSSTVIYNNSNGKIEIKTGKITATSSYSSGYCINNGKGEIEISGGEMTARKNCIYNNNSAGIIKITSGTITSTDRNWNK